MADKKTINPQTGRFILVKEWRDWFSEEKLMVGKQLYKNSNVRQFSSTETSAHAEVIDGTKVYSVSIMNAPNSYSEKWNADSFSCNCKKKRNRGYWDYKSGDYYQTGEHEAALLFRWEAQHGIWLFEESDAELNFQTIQRRPQAQKRTVETTKRSRIKNQNSGKRLFRKPTGRRLF